MGMQPGNIPILILREGTGRTRGGEAQRNNIAAAKIVAEVMKSSLGPKGMDKMLVSSLGDTKITSDGATVLKEIDIQHPAAKMLVEAAKAQDTEVGDGTTSIVVLTGELLRKAEEMLQNRVHPTVISSGYRKALDKCLEILDELGKPLDIGNKKEIMKAVLTAIKGKFGHAGELFAQHAYDAVAAVKETRGKEVFVDKDSIQITKKTGGSLMDTTLTKGIIIDKEVAHPGMPKRVEKAKIALLKCPLEIEKPEISAQIRITSPDRMKSFLDEEANMLKNMVAKIKEVGANVVISQKGMDDLARHYLARNGILAAKNAKESDIAKLEKATGGRTITDLNTIDKKDLGTANLVEERKIAGDKLIFVEGCKDPKAVAILIRAGLEKVSDEAEIAMNDAICTVIALIKLNKVVPGGGAVEAELGRRLRRAALKLTGKEQIAFNAFIDALEAIPRTLAENAGADPLETLTDLRAAHEKKDGESNGVEAYEGKIQDMEKLGVIEPLLVKRNALKAAVETANLILRIDDVISMGRAPSPGGGMGGGMY